MSEEDPKSEATPTAPPPSEVLSYASPRTKILQYSSGAEAADDWVHIFRARDYLEANLLVGKLQEQGLHARVDMENVATLGSWAGGGPGGSNVQVVASEAEQAKRIIDELEKIRAARHAPSRVACPKCGHSPALRQFRPIRVAAIACIALSIATGLVGVAGGLPKSLDGVLAPMLLALGVVLLVIPAMPRWLCPACKLQWAQADPPEIEDDADDDADDNDEDADSRS